LQKKGKRDIIVAVKVKFQVIAQRIKGRSGAVTIPVK